MSRILRLRLRRVGGFHAAGLERGFDVFEHGEPGEEREALKDDGDVDLGGGDGFLVPVDLPADGAERPVSMRSRVDLPEPEGPRSATISPGGIDRSVGEMTWMRFSLGCAIVFLDLFGTDDHWLHKFFLILLNLSDEFRRLVHLSALRSAYH